MNAFVFRFSTILYVRIAPDRLTVSNVKTGEEISEVPEVTVGGEPKKIVAFGSQARLAVAQGAGELHNPFAHPRSLFSDFTLAEVLLKMVVARLAPRRFGLSSNLLIVIHPLGEPAGGYTQIELRVCRELALGAGAAQVFVHEGAPLDAAQLLVDLKGGRLT